MPPFTTLADLLLRLSTARGPRLTWYGDERIELSGPILVNWVTKTANLLVEEFDAGPGTRIGIDLPLHWRTTVWTLAAWRVGATVTFGADFDLVVTDGPERHMHDDHEVIAVALPALARTFPADLPPGATDAAAAVMTYGDQIGWVPDTDPGRIALDAGPHTLTFDELATLATGPAARTLLTGRSGVAASLLSAFSIWRADGSVVLLDGPFATALDTDPDRRERLLVSEHIDTEGSHHGPTDTA